MGVDMKYGDNETENGGLGKFFIGLIMLIAGGYLFLNSIHITSSYSFGGMGFGRAFSSFHGFSTSGYVLVPFIFGIGMMFYNSKNDIGWIFEEGYRAENAMREQPAGTGFGLAQSQELMKQLEGNLLCESEKGKTTFTIIIPLWRKEDE